MKLNTGIRSRLKSLQRANREDTNLVNMTRRSLLRGSFGFAAGMLARPLLADAAAVTVLA
jgi:hypothetical protein